MYLQARQIIWGFIIILTFSIKNRTHGLLQINCEKHHLKGVDCTNYIAVWIGAYHGDSQNNGIYNDLPNFGYSSAIIPQDTNDDGTPVLHSVTLDARGYYNLTTISLNFTTLNVGLSIQVNNILGIDQQAGTITADVVLIMAWVDHRLAWNTSIAHVVPDGVDYVTEVTSQPGTLLPTQYVWVPDLNLVNGNQPFASMIDWAPNVQIFSNGQIKLYGSGSLTANCILDLKKFPFDSQSCELHFASKSNVIASGYNLSWFQSAPQLETALFTPSISWELLKFGQSYSKEFLVSQFYGKGNMMQLSSVLTFSVSLKRYSFYYSVTGIIPNVGLTVTAIVALWVPDPATQIGMLVTIILALVAVGVSTF